MLNYYHQLVAIFWFLIRDINKHFVRDLPMVFDLKLGLIWFVVYKKTFSFMFYVKIMPWWGDISKIFYRYQNTNFIVDHTVSDSFGLLISKNNKMWKVYKLWRAKNAILSEHFQNQSEKRQNRSKIHTPNTCLPDCWLS